MKTPNQFIFLTILASVLAAQAAIVPAPDDQEEPSVVANGSGYFVVWADKRSYGSTEYDIYGARVSNTGEVLDPLWRSSRRSRCSSRPTTLSGCVTICRPITTDRTSDVSGQPAPERRP